ncbi:DUF3305 domain-containing protein [Pigmentiphaga sp.]|jgi:Protein of unknown function (DUF3305).|uniref:DUF3305 domain-containing protein n=1 Tax=Pigmentiphaga sp. TaxID=1977564 RepID=UPI0025DDD092|nr:DUF3305 domain-containing protein [Pigmentiphaga sp.]MBX6317311.1 DUF3305 domain-containing protein [Pigmentiphaga sp.]
MSAPTPRLEVAVLMRKERVTGPMSRWQEWRWTLDDVIAAEPGFGAAPRRLRKDDDGEIWLHPGYAVELLKDDAEGYYLNASTDAPCWFVMWRMEELPAVCEEPLARPQLVTLSYYHAGRLLDAQETVEQLPAPEPVVAWLREFVAENYVAEPKRKRRPVSFIPLQDRFGNPASISTGERRKGEDA